ncbi:MAG: OmpA family protein, partial [Saprospiraceae bacterium]
LIDDVGVYQLNVQPEPEESLATLEVAVGQVIQLDRIYFETAKWDLLEASFEELAELHRLLNEHPSMQIEIHGHTDSRGGENYNQNLSENRAKAVHQYLLDQGVDPSRIAYQGYGELRPIENNETEEGRQTNRRVEFIILALDEANTEIQNISTEQPEEY